MLAGALGCARGPQAVEPAAAAPVAAAMDPVQVGTVRAAESLALLETAATRLRLSTRGQVRALRFLVDEDRTGGVDAVEEPVVLPLGA